MKEYIIKEGAGELLIHMTASNEDYTISYDRGQLIFQNINKTYIIPKNLGHKVIYDKLDTLTNKNKYLVEDIRALYRDTTPTDFGLSNKTDVSPNSKHASEEIIVGGINDYIPVVAPAGVNIYVNGNIVGSGTLIYNGDRVKFELVAPSTNGAIADYKLRVGDISKNVSIQTSNIISPVKKWTLDNPNAYGTIVNDNFGYSVAISGNYAIVGTYYEDEASRTDSGKAYIFDVTTGQLKWTLDNPNAYGSSAYDYFGWSVAISGNYAIVGARNEDDASGGSNSGKAYIFDVTTGQLKWTLDNPNAYGTSASDSFGWSVAIDGNYAIVSAYLEDDASGTDSGKAYIFDVTTGQLKWTLDNPNPYGSSETDQFGYSVAISGNYAIVGTYYEDEASRTDSGKAYIFDVTTGQLKWTLNNPNAYGSSGYDYFGYSVAISGNYVIVGAYLEDDVSGSNSGKAYIFDVTTGQLKWTLDNPNVYGTSAGDAFGWSVAIDGNYAIVGAYTEDDASGSNSGKAYIFDVTTGQLKMMLDNPNAYGTSVSDSFGYSVAISGNYAIVGAQLEDEASGTNSGKAYIFELQ